jgi:hypothetical protein
MGSPWPILVTSDHHNLLYLMSSQVLNHFQAHWVMFLSKFDFKLIWGPGVENVADGPSHCADFIPKRGDDVLLGQCQLILTPSHTQQAFPSPEFLSTNLSSMFYFSTITTLTLDNSALLKHFKTESSLVFHNRKLFVPRPLCTDILFSYHDSCLGGYPR